MKQNPMAMTVLLVAGMVLAQTPQAAVTTIPLAPTQAPLGQKAQVNWTSGQLLVLGSGTAPAGLSEAQAKVRSLGAARADAQRLLAVAIGGVQVDAETTVKNYELQDDTVRTRVSGLVRGAVVVEGSEKVEKMSDGSFIVRVQMAIPLYGDEGLAVVLYPEVSERREQSPQTVAQPSPPRGQTNPPPPAPAAQTPAQSERYSGLIVDARELGYQPCMAPKLLHEDGSEVWGTVAVSSAFANDIGIAAFVHRMDDATGLSERGAPNQLKVKALRALGPAKCNAVLGKGDAALVLAANASGKFLDEFKVTFVY